ncbi:maleylpyruvate isomerase N-terminal domain-containing protein [Mycobacterium sp.]|uniref:maleylpyruvate isomerase N-terminal domain-containing protein n=1 Tax=Mycobacterium sp. TaxID=1785 RepID=UPI002BC38E5F|nr:maleylpyruvate isomerase N-terminal domain-containing protein [Mycobacterium sp.]HKP41835.1 maleylpyruvate isomerase N-terminal domain-containing protein [Mycobacterium sp.]
MSTQSVNFERHCTEIVTQTSLLIGHPQGADRTVPVPSCPGWNVSQLARHVDGGQRWAQEIVATRAFEPPSDVALRDLSGATNDDPEDVVCLADRRSGGAGVDADRGRAGCTDLVPCRQR